MTKTTSKIQKAPMEGVTVLEGCNLSTSLKGTRNSGLSSESFLNFLNLKRLVDGIAAKRDESLKVLMEGYSIKLSFDPMRGGNLYKYDKHPSAKAIEEKVEAINNEEIELKHTCFMTLEEFYEFTKRLDMDQVEIMAKFLLKETTPKK